MPSVLLLGATGFIGRHVLERLRTAGYEVICGVRSGAGVSGCRCIEVDFCRDHMASAWLPRLAGVDFVVNAVGILRETHAMSFEALHVDAPSALFRACAQSGVKKVVQISALGADVHAKSRYHLSKKRADDVLAAIASPWVIVQPSLVFGETGRSAALFTQLASLPVVPLPGDGAQHVQPVHIDDLSTAVVRLIETAEHDRKRVPAVGPRPVTLREFLAALRRGLGLGEAVFLPVPMRFVQFAAALGDRSDRSLLDRESLGMLVRGNVASPARITAVLGRAPRPVDVFIAASSARAMADAARLSWLLPLLRYTVGIVWIVTGILSLGVYPAEQSYALLERVHLTGALASLALYGAAIVDLALGIGVFVLRRRRWLWRVQIALIAGYSAIIAIFLPEFWLHPFGPVLKNLPMLVAILVLHEFERPSAASG